MLCKIRLGFAIPTPKFLIVSLSILIDFLTIRSLVSIDTSIVRLVVGFKISIGIREGERASTSMTSLNILVLVVVLIAVLVLTLMLSIDLSHSLNLDLGLIIILARP